MPQRRFLRMLCVVVVVATASPGATEATRAAEDRTVGPAIVHAATAHDVSPPLRTLLADARPDDGRTTPLELIRDWVWEGPPRRTASEETNPESIDVEQTAPGPRPSLPMLDHFDGLGFGFTGPQGTSTTGNPSDNSLAVGPNHIFETVNTRFAVYTKRGALYDNTGTVLYGAAPNNSVFSGFAGARCPVVNSGDAVIRYDQLAQRWLLVIPVFTAPYAMCYAVSTTPDPLGSWYRYEFPRTLFPDYPRPAVWPDGYYNPTSTGDNVIQKHDCVADRNRMLQGLSATEQCLIIEGVNFLNNADVDGQALPPPGAPNIVMATGGAQLNNILDDDGIYAWKFHVDWDTPANTTFTGPQKIPVAPYHFLCDGQLKSCVPQPGTNTRLDSQGDKIMQRLVYRNLGDHESIVAVHSIRTEAGAGGVRWYEFRLDEDRDPYLHQQGTYAPDGFYRWMASPGIDQKGNIGIGYSFGGTPNYAGQRFAARLADDPLGQLTFEESVIVEGKASQTNTLRWEDYADLAIDPSDDCTFWYVGDYLKQGATRYTSHISSFRVPGCLEEPVIENPFPVALDEDFEASGDTAAVTGTVTFPEITTPESVGGSKTAFDPNTVAAGRAAGLELVAGKIVPITGGLRFIWELSQLPDSQAGVPPEGVRYAWTLQVGGVTYQLEAKRTNLASINAAEDPLHHVQHEAAAQSTFRLRGACQTSYEGTPLADCHQLTYLTGAFDHANKQVRIDWPFQTRDALGSIVAPEFKPGATLMHCGACPATDGMSISASFQALRTTSNPAAANFINGWSPYYAGERVQLAVGAAYSDPTTLSYGPAVALVDGTFSGSITGLGAYADTVFARACTAERCAYARLTVG